MRAMKRLLLLLPLLVTLGDFVSPEQKKAESVAVALEEKSKVSKTQLMRPWKSAKAKWKF